MTLARRIHGGATLFATSQAFPYSTAAAAGDACILWLLNTAPIGSISGWTEKLAINAGGYYMKAFRLNGDYTGTPAQPTATASGGSAGVGWIEHWYSTTGLAIADEIVGGTDTDASSTAFSATGPSITTLANDVLLMALGLKTVSSMTAGPTSISLAQAGATLGALVGGGNFGARLSTASPSNSLHYGTYHSVVSSGGTGAPTAAATSGTSGGNASGVAGFLRLREVASNAAPTANAGSDQTANQGATVNLTGSGSDTDGTIASYLWSIDSAPGGSTAAFSSTTAQNPTFGPLSPDSYTLGLVVTDNGGAASAKDQMVITVNARPVANAGVDFSVVKGQAFQLDGSATDGDGPVASVAWTQLGGTTTALTSTTVLKPYGTAPNVAGTLVYGLTATDNNGLASLQDQVTVTVTDAPVGGGSTGYNRRIFDGTNWV